MSKSTIPALPEGYADWLTQLKGDITQALQRVVLDVNAKLVPLYHRTAARFSSAKRPMAGAPRSLSAWVATSKMLFRI